MSDEVEISLVFVCGIAIDLVLVWRSKMTSFSRGDQGHFVFVRGQKILGFDV